MEKVRVIISGNNNDEFVFFTQDFEASASDFIRPDCKLFSDTNIEWSEPAGFPMESMLHNIH